MTVFFANKLIQDRAHPYQNDYTGRFEEISSGLTELILIEAKDQPLVVSIDAPWGTGKTAFIDMWGQWLLNTEKHLAIKFDAWKNDHSDAPLLALLSELNGQLQLLKKKQKISSKILNKLKETAISVSKSYAPALIKFPLRWAADALGVGAALEKSCEEIAKAKAKKIENELEEYRNKSSTLEQFKESLKEIVKDKILFIFIDELDRCKPTFAISVLEIVKHIFDVENVCCILSTNTTALSKSVKSFYGHDDKEAKDYLERFIDIPIMLPEPNHDEFIDHKIKTMVKKIETENLTELKETLKKCCSIGKISLRVIEKYLRDIRIFLEYNSRRDRPIPAIYYPCVALEIIKRRINDDETGSIIVNLENSLKEDQAFKCVYDFFVGSNDEKKLLDIFNKLHESLLSSYPTESSSELKNLELMDLLNVKFSDLYKTADFFDRYPSKHKTRLENYINHFEETKSLINFLTLFNLSPIKKQNKIEAEATA